MKTDNELIADFMGMPKMKDSKGDLFDFQGSGREIFCIREHELKYRTSWDWLMPVVEKIHSSMSYKRYNRNIGVEITIKPQHCSIYLPDVSEGYDYTSDCWYADPLFSTTNGNYGTTLQCVYDSVIYYIKWYNENEKHQGKTKS